MRMFSTEEAQLAAIFHTYFHPEIHDSVNLRNTTTVLLRMAYLDFDDTQWSGWNDDEPTHDYMLSLLRHHPIALGDTLCYAFLDTPERYDGYLARLRALSSRVEALDHRVLHLKARQLWEGLIQGERVSFTTDMAFRKKIHIVELFNDDLALSVLRLSSRRLPAGIRARFLQGRYHHELHTIRGAAFGQQTTIRPIPTVTAPQFSYGGGGGGGPGTSAALTQERTRLLVDRVNVISDRARGEGARLDPIIHPYYLARQDTNTDTSPETNDELIRRPSAHGANSVSHNLSVKYSRCYCTYKNASVYQARQFSPIDDRVYVDIVPIGESQDTTSLRVPCEDLLFVKPPLGWAVDTQGNAMYSEYIPGFHQRAASDSNIATKILLNGKGAWPRGIDPPPPSRVIRLYLSREFHSIQEGRLRKLRNISITPNLILTHQTIGRRGRYFLMYMNMCIGHLNKEQHHIQIHDAYKKYVPLIEEEIGYEVR